MPNRGCRNNRSRELYAGFASCKQENIETQGRFPGRFVATRESPRLFMTVASVGAQARLSDREAVQPH